MDQSYSKKIFLFILVRVFFTFVCFDLDGVSMLRCKCKLVLLILIIYIISYLVRFQPTPSFSIFFRLLLLFRHVSFVVLWTKVIF